MAFGQTDDDDDDAAPPEKHTVYLIGNLDGMFSFPLQAYAVVADDIYLSDTWNSKMHNLGPVGLAVDEANENLFVSYESFNGIEVFDATDATPLGTIRLWGTSDLAGMVVHQGREHLFVVDRGMQTVFVFDTVSFSEVEQWWLPSGLGAWGIDLLESENLLFVTDTSNTVRWYDIDTHLEVGSFTQTYGAVGIAVTDYPELTVYTQSWVINPSNVLLKYAVNSGVEQSVLTGANTKGVTLNPALGLAYVVADNRVEVIDTETMTVIHNQIPNNGWNPTDILASGVVFAGTVSKKCISHPNGKIYKGDNVTFEIIIQNRHTHPIHEMDVEDLYDNTQLFFQSATPATDDNNDDGQINWSDYIQTIGQDLAVGEQSTITVNYIALEDCDGEILEGVNTARIFNVKDDNGADLPDATGQKEYTIDCKCRTNLDCDDGVFCNGAEICNTDGECESPGNPCPLDDGLYCNGTETDVCDEDLDECEHENPPCEDDDKWCNGTEVCNEDTDTCTNSGPPCDDDNQFCNGDESCDEKNDQCSHSGDPCMPGEECNESTDSCDATEVTDDDDDDGGDKKELWPTGEVTGGCCGCD